MQQVCLFGCCLNVELSSVSLGSLPHRLATFLSVLMFPLFAPLLQMRGSSSYNTQEADVLLRLFRSLLRAGLGPERIGIITPYRGQVAHLRNLFKRTFDEASFKGVHIGTVDAFQGGERDIIFVSSVCAGRSPGPHDTNPERLNVTISRAKHHIIFVGCVCCDAYWGQHCCISQILIGCAWCHGLLQKRIKFEAK